MKGRNATQHNATSRRTAQEAEQKPPYPDYVYGHWDCRKCGKEFAVRMPFSAELEKTTIGKRPRNVVVIFVVRAGYKPTCPECRQAEVVARFERERKRLKEERGRLQQENSGGMRKNGKKTESA